MFNVVYDVEFFYDEFYRDDVWFFYENFFVRVFFFAVFLLHLVEWRKKKNHRKRFGEEKRRRA